MIRIHLFNADGSRADPRWKSFYSTIANRIIEKFVASYSFDRIFVQHYLVLRDIFREKFQFRGIPVSYPFQLPFPSGADLHITSQCMFVEYPDGELRAIDFTDHNKDILKCAALDGFTGAMVLQYDREQMAAIQPQLGKFYPGYYGARGVYTQESDDVLQFSKYVTKENARLYFRGLKTHEMRNCLSILSESPDAEVYENSIGPEEYFKEFGSHKVVLGLPGGGDLCFRDFEAFALKIPLLRPEYRVALAKPLIPNHHYIKIDIRDRNDPVKCAEEIMNRYNDVIQDQEFLASIVRNAFRYYQRYGTYDQIAQRFFEFLQPTLP